jgi:hypothetical protein
MWCQVVVHQSVTFEKGDFSGEAVVVVVVVEVVMTAFRGHHCWMTEDREVDERCVAAKELW